MNDKFDYTNGSLNNNEPEGVNNNTVDDKTQINSEFSTYQNENFAQQNMPQSTYYSDNANNSAVSFSNPYSYESNQSNSIGYVPGDFEQPKKKNKKKKSGKAVGFVAAICAVLLASGGAFYAGVVYNAEYASSEIDTDTSSAVATATTVATTSESGEISSSITDVVESAMPSMVSINVIETTTINDAYSYFFGNMFGDGYNNTYETTASGSGIIIGQNDDELMIVTNNHVVEDATEIAVEFIDGESYDATVKGTSSDNDLAVISVAIADISADTLSQIKIAVLGDSTTLKLGEPAIAIGNALGYGQTVTVGYISATEREVQLTDNTMTLIQTDAAINPGNSGGALLNINGEVIGINSAKYSDTSVEGTGYAIPISDAIPIINSLMNSTYTPEEEKPYLGIYGQDVPTSYQERLGWPEGVYVTQVTSGSPAALAGLEQGDIITALDGTEVTSMDELQSVLEECAVGDSIALTVYRYENGQLAQTTLKATLIARGDVETE